MAVGVSERGTANAGRRRAEKRRVRPKRPAELALLCLGVLAGGGAWAFLVRAAIDFGQVARDGRTLAWAICLGATLGAALCLLLVFVLVSRIWTNLDLTGEHRPRRSAGGRHTQ